LALFGPLTEELGGRKGNLGWHALTNDDRKTKFPRRKTRTAGISQSKFKPKVAKDLRRKRGWLRGITQTLWRIRRVSDMGVEPKKWSQTHVLVRGQSDMNALPPIHLINLNRSIERLRRFREWNGHLENIVRVPATDGSALDREALIRSGYITGDLPYGAGTLGSAISHLKLWEMAASQDKSITIFEDAIVVSHHFENNARKILSEVPEDWDFIQWGYAFNPLFIWVDLGISKVRFEGYGPRNYWGALQEFQAEEFSPAPVKLLHSFGIMGYSISAKGARAALEYCLPLRNRFISFPDAGVTRQDTAIDITLCGLYPSLKAYICIPQLLIRCDEQESVREAIDKS
jgi:GR25 family glycosyltransferase involved in LPS biosynthesis